MSNLLVDMVRITLAPTLKREALAQSVNVVVIAPLLFFVTDNPVVQYGLLAVILTWAIVRVALVAARSKQREDAH
ncbi:hypothetical protein GCM10027271_26880 [Saccharopolyspora gloriosae]|uniref:Uncharacterized protein n=1 Tax=Saccharopolyspora gloriosae TaxID=455344 RepID=A0A840NMZ5_9PSEU|nr:hypothetical protein [Saccharopolyspora gloriosae]MBB5071473.1 hypothetical protein [Saccharopolyspora gloriosae]